MDTPSGRRLWTLNTNVALAFRGLAMGYGWAQWENDVRRWEMETGLSYEQVCVFEGMRIPVLRVLQACRPPRKLMFPLGTVAPHTASLPLSICNQQAAVCS
eukprot:269393-Pelagomonas_calceolata.AAC.2